MKRRERFGLVEFFAISTLMGQVMPNTVYIYIYIPCTHMYIYI